ncbi:ATP citrate lyase subunit 1 [Coemansia sp. RSA 1813]|nr:ATP citrate lyase subunit 1 [Coemansia sp. RSA 1646]KAJ1769085.1 ATP citrate lyase subunit 1 [Coemansia sp. RSA 1843]KAJ2088405.1 ATP citrate lyase subunit 1 [Coemansia sp. RSA 986]KAJ2213842.1 ATP citrate lyase subunit 1 [Coemansia sp. RSA 487]KAJ2569843.1 ATP citrate lyase subunit 1 [Coemansia sp. RSA 1813]
MSAKAIREYDGKLLLANYLLQSPTVASEKPTAAFVPPQPRLAQVNLSHVSTSEPADKIAQAVAEALDAVERQNPWLASTKLVAKPDQLIKRRGKSGLLLLNADWASVKEWISERAVKEVSVGAVSGVLKTFLVEPFVPHPQDVEYYVCIQSHREGDEILFTHEGGIDIGDVDAKATRLAIPIDQPLPATDAIEAALLGDISSEVQKSALATFIERLYAVYVDLNFTYLEINPLVVLESAEGGAPQVVYLDLAAKLDQTAEFESGDKWAKARGGVAMEFPAPFGRELSKEEAYIQELDAKTGASLKLTILNKDGRVWTMVAGGGASVVYSDAIAALGYASELANYGEYSGAPSETQTYEYAKTILDLMTRKPHPDGKVLIIGGGIANFTNVATTFKGIIRALKEYKQALAANNVRVFVRRAGPNWQEGLRAMRELGETLGIEIRVYGPETHVTAIVPLALGKTSAGAVGAGFKDSLTKQIPDSAAVSTPGTPGQMDVDPLRSGASTSQTPAAPAAAPQQQVSDAAQEVAPWYAPFTASTRAIVYGMQPRAVQGMLDFDFICKRKVPSVACMVYPFGGNHVQKFYWGTKETLLPVFASLKEAVKQFPEADAVVNFASCRSVFESTKEMLTYPQLRTVAIIAEGVPERHTRKIISMSQKAGVTIIGPATVGGIKPGCFKIGNTGGMMDNIASSKLYRPGSVAYVSKSGGMSNELNNIVARTTDGVYEGVAIGGDRYPGTTFLDHMMRYEADPECKMLLLLGEVGGVEEYKVAEAVRAKKITKPVVAWCIGTCAGMFETEVQFGHAGALANSDSETAEAKNASMRAAGIHVPDTFEALPALLNQVYSDLVQSGRIVPRAEPEAPKIPIDYAWAQELGLVRKPASFVSTICDDRGQELLYAGMRISDVFKEDIGIGGVLSLLWFKRRLPDYACKFIEMVLMLTADHGPAVSGAHNTIVTARAGKDLISSLCSGLLTIGDRFGGALDGAADLFSTAYDKGLTPREFVDSMRRQNKLILGIGHKIKSRTNPDLRVTIITEFARKNFPATPILDYARSVENITTAKKDNLILNVDGAIGVLFVDLLRHSGAFSREEADEYARIGTLNGLFVLGRSIGFIGHYLDQKRLKQGLYRHPWDDISYLNPSVVQSDRVQVGAAKIASKQ